MAVLRRAPGARRLALAVSLAVHGGLAAGAAALVARDATTTRTAPDEMIAVAIVSEPPPPVVEAPAALEAPAGDAPAHPPEPPAARRPAQAAPPSRAPRPLLAALQPAASSASQPIGAAAVDDDGAAAPVLVTSGSADPAPSDDGDTGRGAANGTGQGPAGAGAGNDAVAARPPALSPADRRALLDRYLKEILRTRISERFRYPTQAEALEIEGSVLMHATIDARGRLVGARLVGACPHPLLCDDAARTVHASAPFPPPPPELGGTVEVTVPLKYHLQ